MVEGEDVNGCFASPLLYFSRSIFFLSFRGESRCSRSALNKEIVGWRSLTGGGARGRDVDMAAKSKA